jgi:hypothetical protein
MTGEGNGREVRLYRAAEKTAEDYDDDEEDSEISLRSKLFRA